MTRIELFYRFVFAEGYEFIFVLFINPIYISQSRGGVASRGAEETEVRNPINLDLEVCMVGFMTLSRCLIYLINPIYPAILGGA